MYKQVFRRLFQTVFVLFGVTLVTFFLLHLAPGQPSIAGTESFLDESAVEQWTKQRNLDKPIPVQYFLWLGSMARGDFGVSFVQNRPVLEIILEKLPATLLLTGTAMVLSLAMALYFGILAAVKPGALADRLISGVSLIGLSVPSFWVGMVLIIIFSYRLEVLPSSGMRTPGDGSITDIMVHMVMPVSVLCLGSFAYYVKYVRRLVLETLEKDYVRTARAKGLWPRQVMYRHALPNAAIPMVTIIFFSLPFLFTGALITEYVFSWPGMGQWIVSAALSRDYPVIMAVNLLMAVLVTLSNLCADILYAVCDPRVRAGA